MKFMKIKAFNKLRSIYTFLKVLYYKKYIKSIFNILLKNNVMIFNKDSSIDRLLKAKKNIARFGDGEFDLILKKSDPGFQRIDPNLSKRLIEVLTSDLDNLLVAIPYSLINLDENTNISTLFWGNYLKRNGDLLIPYIANKKFIDASITRLYIPSMNQKLALKRFDKLKAIWEGKDILFVEGEFSRMGVGNDLFINSKTIKRIICPSKNAFDRIEDILESVKTHGKDKLILCSLGPTATIIAYELAKNDMWCLDIGHIDIEYMWALKNKGRTPIPGRLLNEVNTGEIQELDIDIINSYNKSIIERIN